MDAPVATPFGQVGGTQWQALAPHAAAMLLAQVVLMARVPRGVGP